MAKIFNVQCGAQATTPNKKSESARMKHEAWWKIAMFAVVSRFLFLKID
jgi:hypothetical protein